MYSKPFIAGWGDMDANAHMRNTAFLDRAADVRMMFFAEHGFAMKDFAARRLGPVIAKDEVDYYREVGLLQPITVTLALAGLSADGSRFLMRNDILGEDGRPRARVSSVGGWLDLAARRLVAPPPDLLAALATLPRTADFAELPSSLKP
ncbi:MAG TPA: thioesterase family protein [Roseateles sp.]